MRNYELMYIINPSLDEEATKAVVEKFSSLITANGGEIAKTDLWGKRRMAYEINDLKDGYYVLVNYKGEPAVTAEVDRVIKITDDVMRHLIVREGE